MPETRILSQRELYDIVICDGMLKARESVKIATANVKNIYARRGRRFASLITHFEDLIDRRVRVDVLHSAVPSGSILHEIGSSKLLASRLFTMRRCPRVHFKMILIDYRWMYLGSANLTGAGIGAKHEQRRNFEFGIWTDDPAYIDRVYEQYDAIWLGNACGPCDRKDVCPVPLEEIRALRAAKPGPKRKSKRTPAVEPDDE